FAAAAQIYSRGVRATGIAGLVTAAVLGAGWSLQVAGLPRPAAGDVAAATAASWLVRYRLATSTVRLGGRPVHGRCYHGWFDGRRGLDRLGTLLRLDDGSVVRDVRPRSLTGTTPATLSPLAALELSGCTDVLGPRVASFAIANTVRIREVSVGGKRELALRLRKLTLLVAMKTDRPLGVVLNGIRS